MNKKYFLIFIYRQNISFLNSIIKFCYHNIKYNMKMMHTHIYTAVKSVWTVRMLKSLLLNKPAFMSSKVQQKQYDFEIFLLFTITFLFEYVIHYCDFKAEYLASLLQSLSIFLIIIKLPC